MIPSPELAMKIDVWKQKAIAGTLSRDEMKEAILLMRQERRGAAIGSEKAAAKKPSKAPVIVPSSDDMLKELGLF